jgi:hypothetical protein
VQAVISACLILVSCFAYSSALKTEAIYSSETSVDFHLTSQRYIPEDRTHLYQLTELKKNIDIEKINFKYVLYFANVIWGEGAGNRMS